MTTSAHQKSIKDATPEWLTELFIMFTVNYKTLWTDLLYSEQIRRATDALWLHALKNFSSEIILTAGEEIIKTNIFPPNIADFLEVASAIQRKKKYENEMSEREKNKLIEKKSDPEIAKFHLSEIRKKLVKRCNTNNTF